MKKLLNILVPPLAGFGLYFLGIRYSPGYFNLNIGQIGTGTLAGFMAFYKYTLPLLFAIALLTQLLIVLPVWRGMVKCDASGRLQMAIGITLVCLLFAAGLSYLIWDTETGKHQLIMVFVFMAAVQLVYWLIDFFILYLLELLIPG